MCVSVSVHESAGVSEARRALSSSELPDVAAGDELWSSAGAICTLNQ